MSGWNKHANERLTVGQKPGDFVTVGCQDEERAVVVKVYRGVCRICGWTSEPSDAPHANTAHWATVRHVEQEHGPETGA